MTLDFTSHQDSLPLIVLLTTPQPPPLLPPRNQHTHSGNHAQPLLDLLLLLIIPLPLLLQVPLLLTVKTTPVLLPLLTPLLLSLIIPLIAHVGEAPLLLLAPPQYLHPLLQIQHHLLLLPKLLILELIPPHPEKTPTLLAHQLTEYVEAEVRE